MERFFLIGLFAALAGFLYGHWFFLAFWGIIATTRFVYEIGRQAGRRQMLEVFDEPGSIGVDEHLVAQRKAAAERRQ